MSIPSTIPPVTGIGRFDAMGNYHPDGSEAMQPNQSREEPSVSH